MQVPLDSAGSQTAGGTAQRLVRAWWRGSSKSMPCKRLPAPYADPPVPAAQQGSLVPSGNADVISSMIHFQSAACMLDRTRSRAVAARPMLWVCDRKLYSPQSVDKLRGMNDSYDHWQGSTALFYHKVVVQ